MPRARFNGRELYLAAVSADTAAALAGGNVAAIPTTNTCTAKYFPMGGARGVRVSFVVNADGATATYRLWTAIVPPAQEALITPTDIMLTAHCYGSLTGGACTGISGGLVTASQVYCDTVTMTLCSASDATLKGSGTESETAYGLGTTTVYSPANDTPGYVFVPNVPGTGIVLELIKGTATGVNAEIERVFG